MVHAEATVKIERPVGEVFDFLADGVNNKRWRPAVIEISKASGDGVGAVYRQTLRGPGGRPIQGDYRVTAADRPSRLAFEVVAGPARPIGTFTLRPDGPTSTTVTFAIDLTPHGLMKLMKPAIRRQVEEEVANISILRDVMEGRT